MKKPKAMRGNNAARFRAAKIKLIRHLVKEHGYTFRGLKLKRAIRAYATLHGYKIEGDIYMWLLNLYLSNTDSVVCKSPVGFYSTPEWITFRKMIIVKYGSICMKCGINSKPPHVDHIKPRSRFPELEFDPTNMQILCGDCNLIKRDRTTTDYRGNIEKLIEIIDEDC